MHLQMRGFLTITLSESIHAMSVWVVEKTIINQNRSHLKFNSISWHENTFIFLNFYIVGKASNDLGLGWNQSYVNLMQIDDELS